MQGAQINISVKGDQCAFHIGETVTDLAAGCLGVRASQSHVSGAVCESFLWLMISSFLTI